MDGGSIPDIALDGQGLGSSLKEVLLIIIWSRNPAVLLYVPRSDTPFSWSSGHSSFGIIKQNCSFSELEGTIWEQFDFLSDAEIPATIQIVLIAQFMLGWNKWKKTKNLCLCHQASSDIEASLLIIWEYSIPQMTCITLSTVWHASLINS